MIWLISWRNVWRNKLRSSVVITAVSLGVFAGVFSMAFYKGMAIQRIKSAIKTEVSHIQLHNPAFEKVDEILNYLDSADIRLNYIRAKNGVEAASKRLIVNAIVNSAEKGGGIRLFGIDRENEAKVTDIKNRLVEGIYLENLKRGNPIVIGKKLADKLGVRIGSKLVIGMIDSKGQPVYNQFRVGGIFKTVNSFYDETLAFINYEELRQIAGLPEGSAHELAVYLGGTENSVLLVDLLKSEFPNLDVKEWNEILPELGYLSESMDFFMYIFIIIILLALGFGIVNTMLMVVLERIHELGMLMAVGMNKIRIFKMIMLETVFLSLTGGVIGIIIGSVVSEIYKTRGIDLSGLYGVGFSALGYDSVIYTVIQVDMIIGITSLVILTGIVASVFPAVKALGLNPAEAIRTDV
jgi:ABC-type lipoprotein release transport system permease subunit